MSKVRTFSRFFPSYHPKKSEPTYFVEKMWNSMDIEINYKLICDLNPHLTPDMLWSFWGGLNHNILADKGHTIRAGNHFKVGDKFSPRVWANDINPKSGRSGPYHSKQIIIAPEIEVKKVWNIEIKIYSNAFAIISNDGKLGGVPMEEIAMNDGLTLQDMKDWFPKSVPQAQIICWNENIEYTESTTLRGGDQLIPGANLS